MKRFFLFGFLLASCGIKANPEVLKEPEVLVKRIGERVYVKSLSGEIRIKGFEKLEDYWIKDEREAFCFLVERIGGKSKKFCVEKALEEKPTIELSEDKESVKLTAKGFESYRLYPVKGGKVLLEGGVDLKGEIKLERSYWERCYALTGIEGLRESSFIDFCIKPKEPPPVEEVKNLQIRVGKEKLYLVWFYDKDYKEFIIYKEGKEIGRTVGFSFEVPIPEKGSTFTIKVISPLGFESEGESINYKP